MADPRLPVLHVLTANTRRCARTVATAPSPGVGWILRILTVCVAALYWGAPPARAQVTLPIVHQDPVGDGRLLRTDAGADGPVDPGVHHPPDVVAYVLSAWEPDDPQSDPFTGEWQMNGPFLRLDLTFAGLVNPPGTLGCCGHPFAPFKYGPHPVFGYVEIDVDGSAETGGELDSPRFRYTGNAARFGGLPRGARFSNRLALDAGAFDGNINTGPFVERSGEEFHLALLGWLFNEAGIIRTDETNAVFEPGETWLIPGRTFHRAHGYEPFSYACCRGTLGSYEPDVVLRFSHDVIEDRTTVSLVYPRTNNASAALAGAGGVEALDGDPANQNSVLEGLDDLVFAAKNPQPNWLSDPRYAIIAGWSAYELWPDPNDARQFLQPADWEVTVLVGGSYAAVQGDVTFVWSDMMPNAVPGDFNGSGGVGPADVALFDAFIAAHDGQSPRDEDGVVNGVVDIVEFGPNFSLFDVNYDGLVDASDRPIVPNDGHRPADFDHDRDVDQSDFGHLQACMGGAVVLPAVGCEDADLDFDDDIDQDDFGVFQVCHSGPTVPANPGCTDAPEAANVLDARARAR